YSCFFFSSRRRHTRFSRDWSSDVCSSDLLDEIVTLWREEIGPLPGVSSLILTEPGIGPQGIAVELRLTHPDLATLEAAGRATLEIGRASCRERVQTSVGGV